MNFNPTLARENWSSVTMALSPVAGTEEVSAALGVANFNLGPMGFEWTRKVEVGFDERGLWRRGRGGCRERKRWRLKSSWWEQRMLPPLVVVAVAIFGFFCLSV